MNILSPVIAAPVTPGSNASAISSVGQALLPNLERGERIDASVLREAMERALEELPARYAMILRMRYGMDGDKPRTLEYIAQKLNLSRERVRQIERDAFSRLRQQDDIRKQRLPMVA